MRAAPRAVEASDVQTLLPYPHDLFGGLTDLNGIIPGSAWAKGEGGRAQHTHTATRTRGRSSDWCQRISPQRPKAQTVIPSVAILTGASARVATHTHATRVRGAKGWPRKVKRFALFRRQRGSDTGEYRLRPYGAVGGAVEGTPAGTAAGTRTTAGQEADATSEAAAAAAVARLLEAGAS